MRSRRTATYSLRLDGLLKETFHLYDWKKHNAAAVAKDARTAKKATSLPPSCTPPSATPTSLSTTASSRSATNGARRVVLTSSSSSSSPVSASRSPSTLRSPESFLTNVTTVSAYGGGSPKRLRLVQLLRRYWSGAVGGSPHDIRRIGCDVLQSVGEADLLIDGVEMDYAFLAVVLNGCIAFRFLSEADSTSATSKEGTDAASLSQHQTTLPVSKDEDSLLSANTSSSPAEVATAWGKLWMKHHAHSVHIEEECSVQCWESLLAATFTLGAQQQQEKTVNTKNNTLQSVYWEVAVHLASCAPHMSHKRFIGSALALYITLLSAQSSRTLPVCRDSTTAAASDDCTSPSWVLNSLVELLQSPTAAVGQGGDHRLSTTPHPPPSGLASPFAAMPLSLRCLRVLLHGLLYDDETMSISLSNATDKKNHNQFTDRVKECRQVALLRALQINDSQEADATHQKHPAVAVLLSAVLSFALRVLQPAQHLLDTNSSSAGGSSLWGLSSVSQMVPIWGLLLQLAPLVLSESSPSPRSVSSSAASPPSAAVVLPTMTTESVTSLQTSSDAQQENVCSTAPKEETVATDSSSSSPDGATLLDNDTNAAAPTSCSSSSSSTSMAMTLLELLDLCAHRLRAELLLLDEQELLDVAVSLHCGGWDVARQRYQKLPRAVLALMVQRQSRTTPTSSSSLSLQGTDRSNEEAAIRKKRMRMLWASGEPMWESIEFLCRAT